MSISKEPLENDIQNSILIYLNMVGIFAWKNKSQGTFDPSRGIFRKAKGKHTINGTSDILGILPGGRFLAIEVKRPSTRKQTTPDQRRFIEEINKNGGLAFVACSMTEVKEILDANK